MKVDTDPKKIDEILNRGTIVEVLPTTTEFRDKLLSGQKMRFYIGFDATAPTLHLSHAKNLILLEKFRKLGHEVIVLFGDFTARIGDPSGEGAARKQLSRKEVITNVKKWKKLIRPLMSFNTFSNPPKIKYNHKWLSVLGFEEIISLASNFTVQHIISRDMFQKRLKEEKPIHLHEFLYPLMQGYDSVAMDVDVEICGTDQIFNALAGRTLLKKIKGKNKYVVAVTLMENPKTGELMSKSKGTGVFLDVSSNDMYGQIMAQPDEMIRILFINNTQLTIEEINKIIEEKSPKDSKMRLAFEITKIFHGKEKAERAEQNFIETFKNGGLPENIEEITADNGEPLSELSVKAGVVKSKGEFRRLVSENAVSNQETSDKITDPSFKVISTTIFKIGKRRFLKVIIK